MLAFNEYGTSGPHVILLHGLLGTKRNLAAVARQLSSRYHTFALDLRNHGDSFHAPTMSYEEMADDIAAFMTERQITSASIVGHSMGGKCAMQFAVSHPDKTEKLVVVDIAPKTYSNPKWLDYAKAMYELDLSRVNSRKQADVLLKTAIKSDIYRQFLLSNLELSDLEGYYWKPNLKAIIHANKEISSNTITRPCHTESLFIRGESSTYILDSDRNLLQTLLPQSNLVTIKNAGHLVHFEAKDSFLQKLVDFL